MIDMIIVLLLLIFVIIPIVSAIMIFAYAWKASSKRTDAYMERWRAERDAEEKAQQKKREEEERQFLKELEDMEVECARGAEVYVAFSDPPWCDYWPNYDKNDDATTRRIKRAYEQGLSILSYCPTDMTAKIYGSTGSIYTVSPSGCECGDFEDRHLPCKHMIKLAVALKNEFRNDPYVHIGEVHSVMSNIEKQRVAELKFISSKVPHKNIIQYVEESGPVTRRSIIDKFNVLDEKDVRKAINELSRNGIIQSEKKSGRYQFFIEKKEDSHGSSSNSAATDMEAAE